MFSRIAVVTFGLLMGILAVLLNVAGVSLGWVYLVMGACPLPPCLPCRQSDKLCCVQKL